MVFKNGDTVPEIKTAAPKKFTVFVFFTVEYSVTEIKTQIENNLNLTWTWTSPDEVAKVVNCINLQTKHNAFPIFWVHSKFWYSKLKISNLKI